MAGKFCRYLGQASVSSRVVVLIKQPGFRTSGVFGSTSPIFEPCEVNIRPRGVLWIKPRWMGKRLDDVLDRVARVGKGCRDCLELQLGPAGPRDLGEGVAPIHRIETGGIDLKVPEGPVCSCTLDRLHRFDERKVAGRV